MLSDEEFVIDHADWFEPSLLTTDQGPRPGDRAAIDAIIIHDTAEDPRVQQLRDACDE